MTKEVLAYFWQQIVARIESCISKKEFIATITTTWTGSAAPYTQEITMSGVSDLDNPVVDLILSDDYTTSQTQLEEWNKIYRITTSTDKIIAYATDATAVELSIQLQVVK